MGLATVASRAQDGLRASPVAVEVHVSGGLPGMTVVGLPEAAVREAKDRVRAAILNAGFSMPASRITVNLAPADLPKEGGRFDLAIALGILAAAGQIPADALADREFLGELSLSAELRSVRGALPAALQAGRDGRTLIVPRTNAAEAALAADTRVHAADHLLDVCHWLSGEGVLDTPQPAPRATPVRYPDLADVRGQAQARRALEIAAAGGHSALFIGPPGSGKSMLAARLPGLLPPPDAAEALAIAEVASIDRDGFDPDTWGIRPYRAPHHSASAAAMIGGGSNQIQPGEVTRAHGGVLFLDELPEFKRHVLEVLREPLETGRVAIARAARQVDYPAAFQLIAAMNPCPCGDLGDRDSRCRCTPDQIARYRGRVSGPLLDRIDLHVHVPRLAVADLAEAAPGEPTAVVQARVSKARELAMRRQGCTNAALAGEALTAALALGARERALQVAAGERLHLSGRGLHRMQRVARTIADLAGSEAVNVTHLSEAIGLRSLDRT